MAITENDWDKVFSGEEARVRAGVDRFVLEGELGQLERFRALNSAYRADEFDDLVNLFLLLAMETNLIVYANEFPTEVFRLPNLVSISLHLETETQIPDLGFLMPGLEYLDLYIPAVRQLPSGLGRLKHLKAFDISKSELEEINIDFSDCENLERFTVLFSPLKSLPTGLGRLQRLHLFGDSALSVTWPESAMDRLSFLMVNGSNTLELPSRAGYFPVLEHLMIEQTPVQMLPAAFATWGKSLAIHARGSQLATLPANLLEAQNLTLLDVRETPLANSIAASAKSREALFAKTQLLKLRKYAEVYF